MTQWRAVLVVSFLAAGGLVAQQPGPEPTRRPAREEPGMTRIERSFAGGRFEVIVARRARLGVSVNFAARETDSVGALLNGITPNGPAAQAGLRSGDVITSLNGRPLVVRGVRVPRDQSAPGIRLSELASQLEPGDTVTLQYRRGAERRVASLIAGDEPAVAWAGPEGGAYTYTLDLDELPFGREAPTPAPPGGEWQPRRRGDSLEVAEGHRVVRPVPFMRTPMPAGMVYMLGSPLAELELAPVNPELGRYFGTSDGILVIRTPAGSSLGLQGGDVILMVDGRAPHGPAHLLRILRTYAPSEEVRFEVMRMKRKETVTGTVAP